MCILNKAAVIQAEHVAEYACSGKGSLQWNFAVMIFTPQVQPFAGHQLRGARKDQQGCH